MHHGGDLFRLTGALQRIELAINRRGQLRTAGVPTCRLAEIQPSTNRGALEACRPSLVGEGTFTANVELPQQAPFPSRGKVLAFVGSMTVLTGCEVPTDAVAHDRANAADICGDDGHGCGLRFDHGVTSAGFLLTVGATFGYAAGWNPYATDYTRYLPPDASPKAVGWAAGLAPDPRDRRGLCPGYSRHQLDRRDYPDR